MKLKSYWKCEFVDFSGRCFRDDKLKLRRRYDRDAIYVNKRKYSQEYKQTLDIEDENI